MIKKPIGLAVALSRFLGGFVVFMFRWIFLAFGV